MASLTTNIVINSSDALSDRLSLSLANTISITDPSEMSRVSILHSAPTELAAASTGAHYVYIKNISSTNTKPVDIRTAAGTAYGQLSTGEFTWIPCKINIGVEVIAIDETVIVEYAIFKKA
tara:strand:- start:145 stop:507 length:363 start_codon:yes stop_codon:yes gene_type:complete